MEVRKMLEFLMEEERKHLQTFEDYRDELRRLRDDDREEDDLLTSLDYGIF